MAELSEPSMAVSTVARWGIEKDVKWVPELVGEKEVWKDETVLGLAAMLGVLWVAWMGAPSGAWRAES